MRAGTRKWLGYATALAITLAVFALYLRPDVMVMLADQFWACF